MRRILTFGFIGILLILNINLVKGSYGSYQKLEEIGQEQEKVKELEVKNQDLKGELQNRDSIYFIEQEARNRLGFSRPGETMIVLESSAINEAAKQSQKKQQSNLQSWLELVRH